jgi:8-oxo-dGTP diphosphatase
VPDRKEEGGTLMAICINQNGDVFEEFIEMCEEEVQELEFEMKYPITHSLVVAKNEQGFLLLYNKWKKQWELAGGMLDEGETLRECAVREMLEETNQTSAHFRFLGLMKFNLKNGSIEYGGLFSAFIHNERPFQDNDESREIIFWDEQQDIGYIDEIDRKLLQYYKEPYS